MSKVGNIPGVLPMSSYHSGSRALTRACSSAIVTITSIALIAFGLLSISFNPYAAHMVAIGILGLTVCLGSGSRSSCGGNSVFVVGGSAPPPRSFGTWDDGSLSRTRGFSVFEQPTNLPAGAAPGARAASSDFGSRHSDSRSSGTSVFAAASASTGAPAAGAPPGQRRQ